MKIIAYRVESSGPRSFEDIVNHVYGLALQNRVLGTDPLAVRLEHLRVSNGLIYLDFSKVRNGHGPGQRSQVNEVTHIDLPNDGVFAEDTAIVFDPDSRYLAMQYNHYGPRAKSIEEYLTSFDFHLGDLETDENEEVEYGFEFAISLNLNATARLNQIRLVKGLEFSVALQGAQQGDVQAGRSLSQMLDNAYPEGTSTVKISMKSENTRQGSMDRGSIMNIIRDLGRIGHDVKGAKVTGKAADGSKVDPIDLIEDKLCATVNISRGVGQRYPRDERWRNIAAQLRRWLNSGNMPT